MTEGEPEGISADLPVPPVLEPLLAVHSAASAHWLAEAASTAAERGLGALYGLVYLLDAAGHLAGARPASSGHLRALGRLNQALGQDLPSLKFDPQALPAVLATLQEGRARAVKELDQALPLQSEGERLHATQRQLGVAQVWLAPLHWNGESLGVLLLLMPAHPPASLALAELLARHVAVALKNQREREAGRKMGEVDAVRWVHDEQRFLDQLSREASRAQRHGRPLSILLLRLQNFEQIRDRYGRFLAERILQQIAISMEETMRTTDFLGAFKEDGFAAILVEANVKNAALARQRLSRGLDQARPAQADLPELSLELVSATATLPDDGKTAEELMTAAQARLEYLMSGPAEAASAG